MAYPGPSVSAYPAVQTALSHYDYCPMPYNGGGGEGNTPTHWMGTLYTCVSPLPGLRVPGAGSMVQEVIVERPNGGVMQGEWAERGSGRRVATSGHLSVCLSVCCV